MARMVSTAMSILCVTVSGAVSSCGKTVLMYMWHNILLIHTVYSLWTNDWVYLYFGSLPRASLCWYKFHMGECVLFTLYMFRRVTFVCPEYVYDIDMVLKVQLCQSTYNCISRNQEKCICPNINLTIIIEILPKHNYIQEWKNIIEPVHNDKNSWYWKSHFHS